MSEDKSPLWTIKAASDTEGVKWGSFVTDLIYFVQDFVSIVIDLIDFQFILSKI